MPPCCPKIAFPMHNGCLHLLDYIVCCDLWAHNAQICIIHKGKSHYVSLLKGDCHYYVGINPCCVHQLKYWQADHGLNVGASSVPLANTCHWELPAGT